MSSSQPAPETVPQGVNTPAAGVALAVTEVVRPVPTGGGDAAALTHRDKRTVVMGVMLPMFIGALDLTMVATALPAIAASLNDYDNVAWVITAYLLSSTATTPLCGKLSDIFGRRRVLVVALVIGVIGSAISALAPSMLWLIVGRTITGIGGGGTMPIAQTIIAEITTPMERPRYQGYNTTVFLLATVLGPAIGGVFSDYLSWSAIFWLNVPLGLVALVVVIPLLRRIPRHERPHRLDVAGAVLLMGAGLALMLALNWGGKRYPWLSPEIIALFALSVLLWAGFGWRVTHAGEPFVPLSILQNKIVRSATGSTFFGVGTTTALTIMLPLYLKDGLGMSATEAGLAVMAVQGGATVSSIISSFIIVRLRRYRRVPLAGVALAIVFLGWLALEPAGLSMPVLIAVITLIGVGLGPLYPMAIITVQNVIPRRRLGIATGVSGFFRALGGTFIVAAFGAITLGGDMVARQGGGPGDPAAFRWMFVASIACLLIAAAFLLSLEERPWRGPDEVDAEADPG